VVVWVSWFGGFVDEWTRLGGRFADNPENVRWFLLGRGPVYGAAVRCLCGGLVQASVRLFGGTGAPSPLSSGALQFCRFCRCRKVGEGSRVSQPGRRDLHKRMWAAGRQPGSAIRASTSLRGDRNGVDGTLGFGAAAGVKAQVQGKCWRGVLRSEGLAAGQDWRGRVERGLGKFQRRTGVPGRLWRVRLVRFCLVE